jgi:hypothetical protein
MTRTLSNSYLLCAIAVLQHIAGAEAPHVIQLDTQTRNISISAPSEGTGPHQTVKIVMTARKTLERTVLSFDMRNTKLYSAVCYKEHVAILSTGSHYDAIQCFNADILVTSDLIVCRDPVASPTGIRVVFDKSFPRFTPFESVEPVIQMIDLSRQIAPVVVFPVPPLPVKDSQGWTHNRISEFSWSSDGSRVAFVDRHGPYDIQQSKSSYDPSLVVLFCKDSPLQPEMTVRTIPLVALLKKDIDANCKIFPFFDELVWQTDNSIVASLDAQVRDMNIWRAPKYLFTLGDTPAVEVSAVPGEQNEIGGK